VIENVLSRRTFPEQGFRSCMGILSLGSATAMNGWRQACERALFIKGVNYKSIKSILESNLDKKPLLRNQETTPIDHENIRGTEYYK